MRLSQRTLLTCIALYLFSQLLFAINIQFPTSRNFDEFHYVPSAIQFLEMKPNQNMEHPPLGKEIMAVGIAIFGDKPGGWRAMSTVFGALTLVGMYLWGLALFRNQQTALWVAAVTVFNQILYVQARIGMLDTFMVFFIIWAMAAFTAAWDLKIDLKTQRILLAFTGVMLGLSTACKWFGLMPWFACIGLVAIIRIGKAMSFSFTKPAETDWYNPNYFRGIKIWEWALYLGVIPFCCYMVTFFPLLFVTDGTLHFTDLISVQKTMYDSQLRVVSSHPYMSQWWDWPLMIRPIWYAFDKEGANQEFVRGVICIGNPAVVYTGLLALVFCLWGWIETRSKDAFIILATYVVFYGSWVLIPRKIAFYYYYYPAAMVLGLALAYFFHYLEKDSKKRIFSWAFIGVCVWFFVYFFPILAARQIPVDSFSKWMWSRSWI